MSQFDITKCTKDSSGHLICQTRDGRKARIICTDRNNKQPIVAVLGDEETISAHNADGHYYYDNCRSQHDLINIPEEKWRPYTKGELKLGTEFVEKRHRDHTTTVGAKSSTYIWITGATTGITYETLFDEFIHTDGTPAGVKIQ